MSPNASIIRLLIIAEGLGGTSGDWTVFTANLPAGTPDRAIVCYDTSGRLDGRIMATGEQIEHPGVQVRVRSLQYMEGFQKAQAIAEMLDLQRKREITVPASLGGKTWVLDNISRQGTPLPLGIEEGDKVRHHFTVNALLTVREKES